MKGTFSRKVAPGYSEAEITPKRPKYDKEMREERLKVIGEELGRYILNATFQREAAISGLDCKKLQAV